MMTPVALQAKDPNEELAYSWTPQTGDTISGSATLIVTAGTATIGDLSNIEDNASVRWVLSGGLAGETTIITARATMASGDVIEQEIRIPIIDSGRRCIDLAIAKQHLEYEDDDRDALIQQYIDAAQGWVEAFTGKLMTRRTVTQRFESCSAPVWINYGPDPVVESLTYLDSDLAEQAIEDADFAVVGGRIYPVSSFPYARYGIEASITAGYDGDVPADLISAQLLMIGHLFLARDEDKPGAPPAAEMLAWPYRSVMV